MNESWSLFFSTLPGALTNTLLISLIAILIGAILAIPLMLARVSPVPVLSRAAQAVIEIIRGVPPVVWVFIAFYGVQFGDFRLANFPASLAAFSLISAAYIAEIYRGGFLAVKAGQFEASAALGLSKARTFQDVVAPQMVRVATPGIAAYAVGVLKDTSIVSIIGVGDLVFVAFRAMRSTGDAITPFLIIGAIYLLVSIPIGFLGRWLYGRLMKKVA